MTIVTILAALLLDIADANASPLFVIDEESITSSSNTKIQRIYEYRQDSLVFIYESHFDETGFRVSHMRYDATWSLQTPMVEVNSTVVGNVVRHEWFDKGNLIRVSIETYEGENLERIVKHEKYLFSPFDNDSPELPTVETYYQYDSGILREVTRICHQSLGPSTNWIIQNNMDLVPFQLVERFEYEWLDETECLVSPIDSIDSENAETRIFRFTDTLDQILEIEVIVDGEVIEQFNWIYDSNSRVLVSNWVKHQYGTNGMSNYSYSEDDVVMEDSVVYRGDRLISQRTSRIEIVEVWD